MGWWWCSVTKSYPTLLWSPRTVACQAPLYVGFSKQECWSGLPFPSARNLPDQGSPMAGLSGGIGAVANLKTQMLSSCRLWQFEMKLGEMKTAGRFMMALSLIPPIRPSLAVKVMFGQLVCWPFFFSIFFQKFIRKESTSFDPVDSLEYKGKCICIWIWKYNFGLPIKFYKTRISSIQQY